MPPLYRICASLSNGAFCSIFVILKISTKQKASYAVKIDIAIMTSQLLRSYVSELLCTLVNHFHWFNFHYLFTLLTC